jgi:phosphoribosylamine--glycine ligase
MSRPVMPTRILIVGGGGREHALAWKLGAEPGVNEIVVAPGSAGIAELDRVRVAGDVDPLDAESIVGLARRRSVELVVVGPEAPLAAGLADALEAAGIATFGPTAAAARIEASKAYCHEVAAAAGVAMARAEAFTDVDAAAEYARAEAARGDGVVIKADGLAAGKGVVVAESSDEAVVALRTLAAAGVDRFVVEERLRGPEASVIAICDGIRAVALPAARDHKRLLDGDAGPNTGGMGAYSPLPDLLDATVEAILASVHRPLLTELAARGAPFRGFVYAGLILTSRGPVLLECNARLGDPEAQVILPRLAAAIGPLLLAASRGRLDEGLEARVPTIRGASVGIVLAAGAYPAGPGRGEAITGIDDARSVGALVFHAGTRLARAGGADRGFETNGGRVLTVVGRGADLDAARIAAERAADAISWPGMQRRHDIAAVAPDPAAAAAAVGAAR